MDTGLQLPKSTAIIKDQEGAYRWVYEFNLWRNPSILITLLKIFGAVMLGLFVFLGVLDVIDGLTSAGDVLARLRFDGILMLIFLGLALVGYAIYAIMMGGRYCVLFAMDEDGIEHRQLPKEFERSQVVAELLVFAGIATGKPTLTGIGMLNAARDTSSSSFAAVKSVRGSRALGVIKVNEPLMKNQVYVEPQDYDFVLGYIREHCPNADVKG